MIPRAKPVWTASALWFGALWWLCGQAGMASPSPWAQFRGPGGLGVSDSPGLPLHWGEQSNVLWRIALPGPGTSSPIVWSNRIYLTYHTGFGVRGEEPGDIQNLKRHLLCLDAASGRTLWDQAVDAAQPEQERIREDHGYASSTPVADAERVYVFFGASGVLAFDHQARQLWRTQVGSKIHGWGSAASPVLHGNLVLVNASVESDSLVALDKSSGKEAWRADGIKEAWNTPLLVEVDKTRTEIVVPMIRRIRAFHPETGAELWHCETGIGWYMCPSAVAHDGVVYSIGGRTGGALAVRAGGTGDVTASRVLWRLAKGSNVPSPIYHDAHLYFVHENLGIAYCVEARTGRLIYEERLEPSPGQFYPSPVLAGNRLYYLSRGGQMIVLAATPKFTLLARNPLSRQAGTFNASPAVDGSHLLLRSDRFLYRIGQR